MTVFFKMKNIHPSWQPFILEGLKKMDPHYLHHLNENKDWLPGADKVFNAFSQPISQIKYILLGESPYPRSLSANGYAFWDAAVTHLWSENGLSTTVNRATSLRNIIKMLLHCEGLLNSPFSQHDIAKIKKDHLVQTNDELFHRFLEEGFLLLNASLVLQPTLVNKDAKAWQPFLKYILEKLFQQKDSIVLILLGKIAKEIDHLIDRVGIKRVYAEHPYNLSFISNPEVIKFFKPFHLLVKKKSILIILSLGCLF